MDNFNFITPTEYYELVKGKESECYSLEELREMSHDDSLCDCGEPVWRLGGCGLCFTCTTGEADASDDYELIPED